MRIEIGPLVVETTATQVVVSLNGRSAMLTWEQWCGLANLVDTQMPEKIDEGDEWKRPR
jgi:hypothetical protein